MGDYIKEAVPTFMASSPPPLTGVRVIELAGLAPGTYQPSSTNTNGLSNSAPKAHLPAFSLPTMAPPFSALIEPILKLTLQILPLQRLIL